MWDLPRPGLEPVSPVLAGRFSTTAPPGKPSTITFLTEKIKTDFSDLKIKNFHSFLIHSHNWLMSSKGIAESLNNSF